MTLCKHCYKTIEPTNLGKKLSGGRYGPPAPGAWVHCIDRSPWCFARNVVRAEPLPA